MEKILEKVNPDPAPRDGVEGRGSSVRSRSSGPRASSRLLQPRPKGRGFRRRTPIKVLGASPEAFVGTRIALGNGVSKWKPRFQDTDARRAARGIDLCCHRSLGNDLHRQIISLTRSAIRPLIPTRLFSGLQPAYHFALAFLAALRYGFPARRMKVIGITGTKGKTTTVRLLHEVLSASGARVASVSSLEFRIGERAEANTLKMTMPGRFLLQRFLRRAVAAGCRYAVLETTSQGIMQFRHRGIRFAGAAMTNVAPEHLEAHGGFEAYLRAKLDLFWRLPKDAIAVINRDDPEAARFAAATAAHTAFYGKEGIVLGAKEWRITDLEIGDKGISFSVAGVAVRSLLLGQFNFYNILAAIAVGLSQGIALQHIAAAIGRVQGIPGRMEFVSRVPFSVVVDYAHTPDSLKNAYAFLREIQNSIPDQIGDQTPKKKQEKGKLICVLGAAGGGRDRWKRPEMGRIAAEYCDEIILTNEDPYDENPEVILDEIASGFSQLPNARKIIDRREAIGQALRLAAPGDTVVITGKGAEPWIMGPNRSKIAWDDRRVVREAMASRADPGSSLQDAPLSKRQSKNSFSSRNRSISSEPRTDDAGVLEQSTPRRTDEGGAEIERLQQKGEFLDGLNYTYNIMSAKKIQDYQIVPEAERLLARVRGKTLEDLFQNALRATASVLSPASVAQSAGKKKITREISVQAVDISSLLVEFLTRALAEADAHGAVFTAAAFRAFGENFLEAEIAGVRVEEPAAEIRAISYADVDIKRNPDTDLFETSLVLET